MALGFGIGIPFIRRRGGGPSNTPRTSAFLTATGITDATIISALNAMDTSLISAGLLPAGTGAGKIFALYPFVGGTAGTHKFNFVNPLDTDAAFRIVWFGGVTHNANGVTGNGANAYGNTFINPSLNLLLNSTGASYLCSNTGIDGNAMFGVQDASTFDRYFHFPAFNAGNSTQSHVNAPASQNTPSLRQGFHTIQRTSSTNQNTYRNGVLNANVTINSNTRANRNIFILCYNNAGTPATLNSSNVRFFAFHESLNTTEALSFYNANVLFQTLLGRNV
jgi:hypothetical protein